MNVRNIMTGGSAVVTIRPHETIADAAAKLVEHQIGALPVVDDQGGPVGLIAERELARAIHEHRASPDTVTVDRAMQRPPPTCDIGDEIRPIMARMTRKRLRHLIVCEGDRLAGILSVGDLLKHRLEELELEAGVLRDVVAGQRGRG